LKDLSQVADNQRKEKNANNGIKSTIGKYPILIPKYREVSGSIGKLLVKYRETIGEVSG
jgi:hypothetical protein